MMALLDDVLVELKEHVPGAREQIPFDNIPRPVESQGQNGSLFSYSALQLLGLPEQIMPNVGLNQDVAVASLVPEFTDRLMADSPAELTGPAAEDEAQAAIAWLNFPKVVDAIEAWTDYGIHVMALEREPYHEELFVLFLTRENTDTFFDILRCFKSYSASITADENGTVTHYEIRIEDLPEQ